MRDIDMSQHETAHEDPIRDTKEAETTEPKLRTLNVEVPEEVYWHVRKCATESRLSMKEYMARFCQEARPYPPRR
jgi:hypothetical protein